MLDWNNIRLRDGDVVLPGVCSKVPTDCLQMKEAAHQLLKTQLYMQCQTQLKKIYSQPNLFLFTEKYPVQLNF